MTNKKNKLSDSIKKKALKEVRDKFSGMVSEENLKKAEKNAHKLSTKAVLAPIWDKIRLMFEIVKNPKLWGPKVFIPVGAALLYLVSPIDVIADVLPGIGFSDDIFVILFALKGITDIMKETDAEKWREFLSSIPEKLRPVAVSVFGLQDIVGSDGNAEEYKKEVNSKLILGVYGGAGKLYGKLYRYHEKAVKNGKADSVGCRICGKIMKSLEFGVSSVLEKTLVDQIQRELDLAAQRSEVKDLAAFICYALGIASFRFLELSPAMNYISVFFLSLSYAFFVFAIIRWLYLFICSVSDGRRLYKEHPGYSFAECIICAGVERTYNADKEVCRKALEYTRKNKEFSRIFIGTVYRLFNYSLQRTIVKMVLISFGLYLMKVAAVRLHFHVSVAEMLILPFRML